jgi:hypothetical protein
MSKDDRLEINRRELMVTGAATAATTAVPLSIFSQAIPRSGTVRVPTKPQASKDDQP